MLLETCTLYNPPPIYLLIHRKGDLKGPGLRLRREFAYDRRLENADFCHTSLGLARSLEAYCYMSNNTFFFFSPETLTGQLILGVLRDPSVHPILIDHLLDSNDPFITPFLTDILLKPFSS